MKFVLRFTSSAAVWLMTFSTPLLIGSMAYGVADIVAQKGLSVQRGQCSSVMLGIKIGDQLNFFGLLEGHHFELEVNSRRVKSSDQLRASIDF